MLLASIGILISCKKGKDSWPEEFPVVKITSASYNAENASVTITAEIVSSGVSAIEGAGFRLSDRSDFQYAKNEVFAEVVDNKFTYTYYHFLNSHYDADIFNGDMTIHVFAFAISENGFGVSELQQIGPFEVVNPAVPCNLIVDEANLATYEYNLNNSIHYYDYNDARDLVSIFYQDIGSHDFVFLFNKVAAPGIYTTTDDIDIAGKLDVEIYDDDGHVVSGQQVYIEIYDDEHLLVSICDSPYDDSGAIVTLSASFLVDIHGN